METFLPIIRKYAGSARIGDEAFHRHEDMGFDLILYRRAAVERPHGIHQRHPIRHFVLARSFYVLSERLREIS
jgi:hypothetical protein